MAFLLRFGKSRRRNAKTITDSACTTTDSRTGVPPPIGTGGIGGHTYDPLRSPITVVTAISTSSSPCPSNGGSNWSAIDNSLAEGRRGNSKKCQLRLKNPINNLRSLRLRSKKNNDVPIPFARVMEYNRCPSTGLKQALGETRHRLFYHSHVYSDSNNTFVLSEIASNDNDNGEAGLTIPASFVYEQLSKDRGTSHNTKKDKDNNKRNDNKNKYNCNKNSNKYRKQFNRKDMQNNAHMTDDDAAVAAADKEMEERATRAKELLSKRYKGLKSAQEARQMRKMQLERNMVGLPEEKKQTLRRVLDHEEMAVQKENRKKISTSDFESLAVIGRGAFGEVRLVRRKGKRGDSSTGEIFALKSMKKEMMVVKNQVGHVRAERDALAKASETNRWLTVLHYSFFDETHLYMTMEFLPGGDLMSLLIKEDTFSEEVTRFFMAEAAQAISSVHALGYIHRDIKPDNMLLDARGHLKLTDLGLCKKVGEVSPGDDPEVVLEIMKNKGMVPGGVEPTSDGNFSEQRKGAYADAKHRDGGDAMAMSIDDGLEVLAPQKPQWESTKARREMAYSTVGTPDYIAPEVLAAQNGASGYSYTCAVDWWSLGVIMFECLVGYTPFYADDPVTTCRKILRWRQCLDMPSEVKNQLSPECIDFLSCLLAGPESRIGSDKNGVHFENGFKQVVQHAWFRGFDWEGLRDKDGPLVPCGFKEFPELLKYLRTCPKSDPRFKQLVQRVTQNFDTFEDFGSNLDRDVKTRVNRNALDQFYDYSYRRARKPRVPLPEMLNES